MTVSLWKENSITRKIPKMCKSLFLFFLNSDEEKVDNFFNLNQQYQEEFQ